MTYLAGCSVCYSRPSEQDFDFLGAVQTAAYFRAFDRLLSVEDLAEQCCRQIAAAAQAAGWPSETLTDIPLFVGSTAYTVSASERPDFSGQTPYSLHELADALGKRGYRAVYSFASSCTSSAHALMQAKRLLSADLADRALVLGIESFNLLTLLHFHSLGLLGREYRPFERSGMVLGEAAACLALSRERPSENRAGETAWRLRSAVAQTDAAQLAESGSGAMEAVIRAALAQTGIAPEDIAEIKVHGVGSAGSDRAEAAALAGVFRRDVPLRCFKPLAGHTLGAGAAVETALWYAARQGRLNAETDGLTRYCLTADGRVVPDGSAFSGGTACAGGQYLLALFFGFGGNLTAAVWESR